MGRKHGAAAAVDRRKAKGANAAPNRFEFKQVRPKQQILGQRAKGASGTPGASRKRAQEMRRQQLLPQLRNEGKANQLRDKRLGEGKSSLSKSERQTLRLAFAKRRELRKARRFALGEEEAEPLTHFGQSLANVERYERPLASDDEDDRRGLSEELVSAAHFGGGESALDAEGKPLSRKDALAAAIARSKEAKAERQRTREEGMEATEALDDQLSQLRQGTALTPLFRAKEASTAKANDAYDSLFRSLGLDNRVSGPATKKLPTPAEMARKAATEAATAEAERLARQEGRDPTTATTKPKTIAGTATGVRVVMPIGGGLTADEDPSLAPESLLGPSSERSEAFELLYDEEGKAILDTKEEESKSGGGPTAKRKRVSFADAVEKAKDHKDAVPKNYQQFKEMVAACSSGNELRDLLQRLATANAAHLAPENKSHLLRLFRHCLRAYDGVASDGMNERGRWTAHHLAAHAHAFAQKDSLQAAEAFQRLLAKHIQAASASPSSPPSLRLLLLLRLIRSIFPASDLRHPIVTPALELGYARLRAAKANGPKAGAKKLLLAAELLSYSAQSRRYSPEVAEALRERLTKALPEEEEGEEEKASASSAALPPPISVSEIYSTSSRPPSKASLARLAVETASRALRLWVASPAFPEIAKRFSEPLERLRSSSLCSVVSGLESQIAAALAEHSRAPAAPPPAHHSDAVTNEFQFLEPRLESSFKPGSKRPLTERARLRRELRAETRGSVRELRKDAAFVAAEAAREAAAKDATRRAKTKALMSSLRGQEAEYQRYQRTKHFKR